MSRVNFLAIFISKLCNLALNEATFDLETDSALVGPLQRLCKDLEDKAYTIVENMLGDGDFYIFPATNDKGEIIHSYLTQQQVRILNTSGDEITEAYGIIDYYVNSNNQIYYLLRHHKLDNNGTLTISYQAINQEGKSVNVEKWQELSEQAYSFTNANHIGFGRYKSPTSSRGLSPVYGVPLNFGCKEIEDRLFNDLKLIDDEFRNGKSKIFADPTILRKIDDKEYNIPENVFPINRRSGETGSCIDIFSPALRFSDHYSKLVNDMALYEKQIGTSKGILTDNETSYTATATAVKRSNADTLALLSKIQNSIDIGNTMTLKADGVFLNISNDLWQYKSDYYDPFEDPDIQWQRLIEAKQNGAIETSDLTKWLFPNMTQEEIEEKLERITASQSFDTENAINKILAGG